MTDTIKDGQYDLHIACFTGRTAIYFKLKDCWVRYGTTLGSDKPEFLHDMFSQIMEIET